LKKYLGDTPFMLFHIAKRQQGLVVQKGNPKDIKGIKDLARADVKFINRQTGSGTRILLDTLLNEEGVKRHTINGYDREESSHTAIGILVRESVADAGVAIHSIARIFSLDFIPLAEEDYDLLVSKEFAEDSRFKTLMELVTSDEFKKKLDDMGGYDTRDTGKLKYINK
jgi:putative molybdopterin biosynthesis protein